jgi:predicted permease
MREWISRLFAVGRRGQRDRDLADELAFHLDRLAADHERRGLTPAAARREAERELGGVGRTQQAWRDQRTLPSAAELVQDAAYGWRMLRRSPGLTITAGLMLALAVAATTSVFSVVDAVLLAPLPFTRADRLVVITEDYLTLHAPNVSVAPGNFLEWQARSRAFSSFTAIDRRQQNLTSGDEPLQLSIAAVSAGFAPTIGVQAVAGRLFTGDQFQAGRENVVIISHALWVGRYAGDPGAIGRQIVLDDHPYTIVGVMPAGFMLPSPLVDAWVPLPMTAADRENRTGHGLAVVARLRDHVTFEAAARDLHAIAGDLRREYPDSNKEWDVTVVPARTAMVGPTTTVVAAAMGAVALLLCVACANVAGLLLTHGLSRGRELAIRAALGAGRLRVIRQLLTESLVLSLAGAAAGVLLAWAAQPLLAALRPAALLTWKPIALDVRALVFSFVVAVAAGVVFGTVPALVASRSNIAAAASERTAARGSARRCSARRSYASRRRIRVSAQTVWSR